MGTTESTLDSPPAPATHARGWKRAWRWFSLVLLALVLAISSLALYFNKVDLPAPVRDLVIAEFSNRGWELQFTRMRLRWHRGLVIEDLSLRPLRNPDAPALLAPDAQIRIHRLSLLRLETRVDAVLVHQGALIWDDQSGGEPVRATAIELKAHRLKGDLWELTQLRCNVQGVNVDLQGMVTNAMSIAEWPWPRREKPEIRSRFVEFARQIHLHPNTTLTGSCAGDGRFPESFRAQLQFNSARLISPWFSLTNLSASAELFPPSRGTDQSKVRLSISSTAAHAALGDAGALKVTVRTTASAAHPVPTNFQVTAAFESLRLPKASLTNLSVVGRIESPFRGQWPLGEASVVLASITAPWAQSQDLRAMIRWAPATNDTPSFLSELNLAGQAMSSRWTTNGPYQLHIRGTHARQQPWPEQLAATLDSQEMHTPWGGCDQFQLAAAGSLPAFHTLLNTNLPWTERLAELPAHLNVSLSHVQSKQVTADQVEVRADWRSPQLLLQTTNRLYGGEASLDAQLNTLTQQAVFAGTSTFDLQRLTHLLNTNGQRWLTKYTWERPPRLYGQGQLRLPDWTNRHPDWRTEVWPTLSLAGGFEIGPAAYRDVPFNGARSPCTLTNLLWQLPALEVERPEGVVHARYQSHIIDRDFQWEVDGALDPRILQPLLVKPFARQKLAELEFTTAPRALARITGRWGRPETLNISGAVAATNFAFRKQLVASAVSTVFYTNQFLSLLAPEVLRPHERGTADGIGVDFSAQRVYLTNGASTLDPMTVAVAIGDRAAQTLEPYHFDQPPYVRVQGYVDVRRGNHDTDLRFDVEGGPFHWKRCHLDHVMGTVLWQRRSLILTNLQGLVGGGQAAGQAHFDFDTNQSAVFGFRSTLTEVELRNLIRTFFNLTNKLEGLLSGELVITNASTADIRSWMGYGSVDLRDGLIWDIPMLGVFTPILNAFVPGLGNSRARQAVATFAISNSVALTSDLAIDASGSRMRYNGLIAFDGRVQGRMEAELLRNVPAIGAVISRIFWPVTKIFEYRVAGTLQQPKTQPVWIIPRILFLPFRPLKTVRELFPAPPPRQERAK